MKAPLAAAAAVTVVLTLVGCAGTDLSAQNTAASEEESTSQAPSLEGTPYVALPAGSQSAPNFLPPLTYTAPDGWLTEPAAEGFLALVPDTTENRERIRAGEAPITFLNVFPNVSVAAEDCAEAPEPGVGWVASDMVGALATRSGLSTSGPVAITLGGLSGQQIDVSLASDWTGTCSGGGPFVPLVYSPGFIWWGAEPGEQFRFTVLDVGNLPSGMYATVMIVVYPLRPLHGPTTSRPRLGSSSHSSSIPRHLTPEPGSVSCPVAMEGRAWLSLDRPRRLRWIGRPTLRGALAAD